MSDVKRYTAVGDGVVKTNPAGPLVEYTDYARLKAEVERLTDENVSIRMERMQDETGKRITYADYAELKAEVGRLTSGINPEGHNDLAGRAVEHCLKLKAEVERLRKAGDDMAFHYQELVRLEWGQMTTHIPPSVVRWLAAKEGKQS